MLTIINHPIRYNHKPSRYNVTIFLVLVSCAVADCTNIVHGVRGDLLIVNIFSGF